MSGGPWKCGWCRKTAKATAYHCQNCGGSWEDADPDFDPPARSQSQKKQKSQWSQNWGQSDPSWSQRPRTPRGSRQHGKGRGSAGDGSKGQKGKAVGKGKHKAALEPTAPAEGYAAVIASTGKGLPPEPPWRPSLPAPQGLAPPLPPPAAPAPVNQAAQTLSKLTAAIKKQPDKYDPEVHAILQGAALAEGHDATDQMFKSVGDLGKAREALDAARLGRSQNHVRWRDFLTSAVARWQEYTADFQAQERQFMEAIETAKNAITVAKERFEVCKATLSEDELKVMGDVATDVPMEKSQEPTMGASLQEGLDSMAANLITLQNNAVAMVEAEQQAAKRPRLDSGEPGGGVAPSLPSKPPGSKALEPFAVRPEDKELSFHQPDKM